MRWPTRTAITMVPEPRLDSRALPNPTTLKLDDWFGEVGVGLFQLVDTLPLHAEHLRNFGNSDQVMRHVVDYNP